MRPLRHNFFEVVSWVASFFVAYWEILVSNPQQMRRSETCTRFISPVFHPILAHCIRQREAIRNATRTELPPHLSLTLLLLGQLHKTR